MKTRFSKDVAWLAPFYDAAKHLIPKTKRVTAVRGYKVPIGQMPSTEASCIRYADNRKFCINILTHNHSPQGKQRKKIVGDILLAFAHEIAHVLEWEHTVRHWKLEHKIALLFAEVLKEQGYTDTSTRNPRKSGSSSSKRGRGN